MKTKLTFNELLRLQNAYTITLGTSDYLKYKMESDYFMGGKWTFYDWGIPFGILDGASVKKYKNNYYIIIGDSRWKVTPDVNELLDIY